MLVSLVAVHSSLAMALKTFGFILVPCMSIGCTNAQPIFPDGVAAIAGSMSDRQKTITAATGDDGDKVKQLVRGAAATLKEDLVDEAALLDLQQARQISQRVIAARCARCSHTKQAALAKTHLRVLQYIYSGGCARDMTGCPNGWIQTQACLAQCVPFVRKSISYI